MGKKFKKLISLALSFAILATFCTLPMTASAEDTNLKFGSDGKFKIVIFSDVQDQYPVHQRVIRIMEQAIEREKPDLVVFTGDMTEINTKDVEVDYRRTVEQILGPVVKAGIPYSIVFGNHDPQSYYSGQVTSKDAMLAVWQSIGDCRTIDANPELSGTGTCKLPIYASNGNNIAFNLWMLDSGSYQNPLDGKSGYGSVQDDQLAWMAANNDAGVNSIAFQHIPMPEMYNLFVEDANGTKTYNGKTYKLELIDGVTGKAGEFPAPCPADKSNEYSALKEMGNVLGVVTGHDHLNDFSGKFENDGLTMTAVPGMTYFNYGDEAVRGYGVIELDEADLSTYNYHSVKFSTLDAEAGGTTETVYDEYDEITYSDLKQNGNAVGESYTISGGHNFTYDVTSPSNSAVFKFRWTAGSKPGFQVSFDGAEDGNITYPFGLWIKRADQTEPNGSWHLKPNDPKMEVKMDSAVKQGDTYDIEMGRLKVLSGDPKNVGMYYIYLKVNGKLIKDGYTNTDENGGYVSNGLDCSLNNVIRFGAWGNGGDDLISKYVEPVTEDYAAYDVIGYNDLLNYDTLEPLAEDGMQLTKTDNSFKYNESEAAAATHSVIVKLRWTMETLNYFQMHLSTYGSSNNFAYRMNYENWHDRGSGATIAVNPTPTEGTYYDLEVARLKVTSGANEGKYYTYFKVNGEKLFEKYVSADDTNTANYLSNSIYLGSKSGNTCFISATAEPEEPEQPEENPESPYYAYDEITYSDLKKDGNSVSSDGTNINSGNVFTYDATSPTYSAIFKFRWTAGSDTGIQFSFDKMNTHEMSYPFGVWVKKPNDNGAGANGAWHLKPTDGNLLVDMDAPVSEGNTYDIELARLKVKNGDNAGKYYVYLKVDGVLIQETYVEINEDGTYTSGNASCHISNEITFCDWGGYNNIISATPIPVIYEAYDEIGFDDLFVGTTSMSGQTMTSNQNYTYNATSPSYSMIFKYRWIAGGNEMKFTTFLDDWVYPFCFAAKTPNQAGFGAQAGPNGSWHLVPSKDSFIVDMDTPVAAGQAYDIELARLKVANGVNAGKYYVYAKVNGELIQSYYYDGVSNGAYGNKNTQLSNKIIIAIPSGNKVTATPYVEEYEAYDEIGYEDLKDANGNSLGNQKAMSGANVFTYDKTSATGSVIFKYRWKIGDVAKFQMSFDKTSDTAMAYMFGAWLSAPGEEANFPNGRMWLRPAYGPQVNLAEALVAGTSHNVEFARLKVKNGSNKGKYYVYIKIDDVLVAEDYVAADVVDANGNYTTNPGAATLALSNEIFFAFWGSEGNSISAYKEYIASEHLGTRGDFDDSGVINAEDLVTLRRILLGALDTSEMPEGIADFNNYGGTDIRDLVAMKKYLVAVNSYEKSGSLNLGMQEHLNEYGDTTKSAAYIADATATIGANTYRLSMGINSLFDPTISNGVTVDQKNMSELKDMVAKLKAKGIDNILFVSPFFVLPYQYNESYTQNGTAHHGTVPNPVTDRENYIAWLEVNAAAYKTLAEEVPEIRFFEPFNEINLVDARFEKLGSGWNASQDVQDAHKYTVEEKAGIMADLCWYISNAVKEVNPSNQITTPSMAISQGNSNVQDTFANKLYEAIESGVYPTNKVVADKIVDNYFTIVNVHCYPSFTNKGESYENTNVSNFANGIISVYNTVKAHGDGGSRVWITETGMSTGHPDGADREMDISARILRKTLEKINTNLTFVDTVILYKLADMSSEHNGGVNYCEQKYGLFYAADDLDTPYGAKETAKVVYSFFHNGSTDYSALTALAGRYN